MRGKIYRHMLKSRTAVKRVINPILSFTRPDMSYGVPVNFAVGLDSLECVRVKQSSIIPGTSCLHSEIVLSRDDRRGKFWQLNGFEFGYYANRNSAWEE